ncbi:MAG: hypothetical protein PHC62_02870 [Candidatus Izemoplasmatales bacterium]|jgi:hypothetical protein|nr:hypothetical protein [Candidatus Izemoplasmatales bacterium]
MKIFKMAGLIYLVLEGVLMIMLSFDVFQLTQHSFFELLGGFLLSALPGFGIILIVILLRKKILWLGLIMVAISIGMLIGFNLYRDMSEKLLTIFTLIVPLFIFGCGFVLNEIFLMKKNKSTYQE